MQKSHIGSVCNGKSGVGLFKIIAWEIFKFSVMTAAWATIFYHMFKGVG